MKPKNYEGKLKDIPKNKIYLNINQLEKGEYILKIVSKNKIIKSTSFTKH